MSGVFGRGPEPGSHDPADLDPGVLGRLPRTRPGSRSPRRDDAASMRGKPAPKPRVTAQATPEPSVGALEEAARAGVGIAIGAAGLGLRIAGRALGAIRDAAPGG